ncbi:MAG: hypothetical protein M3279_05435, partial [Actinomycetota bacterium]|nr:hypothetical protein [Actinomycetota bacterium]
LGVTGMDYEIFLNHTVPDKNWNVYLQENHINATRAIIKTAMAYALYQSKEFNARTVKIDPKGTAGYVFDPKPVSSRDKNGPGTRPGPGKDGVGANGRRVRQRHYRVSNMKWFRDTSRLMPKPFVPMSTRKIARQRAYLNKLDTLVIADRARPRDKRGRVAKPSTYFANIGRWVKKGGNLVLTDRALRVLPKIGVVDSGAVTNVRVYQPYADFVDFEHPMVEGLRPNARQLVEAAILGYCIGSECSPMTVVDEAAFTDAGGHVVGTTGEGRVSVGEVPLGKGTIRILGGALPRPTETFDHRYGLRDYALTYSGLYIMENSIVHDAPNLGAPKRLQRTL